MSDKLDPGLRRLFAETVEAPADEAFVAGVTRRTSRERGLRLFVRLLAGLTIFAAILVAMAAGLGEAVSQSVGEIVLVVSSSPVGWAAGLALAFAGVVCVRTLAPLVRLARL